MHFHMKFRAEGNDLLYTDKKPWGDFPVKRHATVRNQALSVRNKRRQRTRRKGIGGGVDRWEASERGSFH